MPPSRWPCTCSTGAGPSRTPTSGGRPSVRPPVGPSGSAGVPAEELIGVGCTAQWSGTVAVGADGSPLMRGRHLDGLAGQPGHPQGGRGRGQRARLRPAQDPPLGTGHRRGAGAVRKGPGLPHPVHPGHVPRRLRADHHLPGTGRLPQPQADRTDLCLLRLHRRPLGDRQPGDRPGGLRQPPARDDRTGAEASSPTWCRRAPSSARSPPGPPRISACPPALPVAAGSGDVHSAVFGSGAVGRLRGPPLHRHLVVDLGSRPVQEDGTDVATWPPSRPPWPAST